MRDDSDTFGSRSNDSDESRPLTAEVAEPAHAMALASAPPQLSAIYREHVDFVWRSLRRLGAPEPMLEDATQDVFLVAARRIDEFEGRSSVRTWLFGIAMRVVKTQRRTLWRHKRKLEAVAWAHDDASPGDPTARRDAQRILLRLLEELDDDRRAVYVLAELEGMTANEIAEGLGVNVNTVYTRLRAARKQLREAAERLLAQGGERT